MINQRILVISCEAFSDSNSNGRTIKNMLLYIPKSCIAQFYIHGNPDTEFCKHYFNVSDNDALRAFLGKKSIQSFSNGDQNIEVKKYVKPKRSYRNLVLRNMVWQSRCWWTKDFDTFLRTFNPDIVLLQAGDSPFMYSVAIQVADFCKAKLVMYNSESYVLKKYMYASTKKNDFWHFLLMSSLKRQYRKFMKHVDYCIYSMEALEMAYQQKFPHINKSCSLYTVSELSPLSDENYGVFSLLYCGNLGVGRDKPLAELAKTLYEVDKTAVLDIYGKFRSKESEELVCNNPNVQFHGFVDYKEIPNLMKHASMLVHCENNDRLENLKYAFSTKIADSIASTRPFLVYASREYPFIQYLQKNNCAHIASTPKELKDILKKCIEDDKFRFRYSENAKLIAMKNHNKDVNSNKIVDVLSNLGHIRGRGK